MKQLLQDMRAKQPHLADVPVPTPGPGMLLVRNAASLVSAGTERTLVEFAGSSLLGKARSRPDLLRQVLEKARRDGLLNAAQAAFGRLGDAMPLGYSCAGTVVELGEGVQGLRPGQRVACAGGGYAVHAEYVCVPQNLVAALPDEVDFDSAAFATLGAIALHGFRLAEVQLGARVAVIGLGLLGQLAASLAAAAGCEVLGVDTDPRRVALAKRRGLDAVVRDKAEKTAAARSAGHGYDAVLICADTKSDDPVELAGEIARERATVVAVGAVGLSVPRRSYYAKELNLIISRSYGPGRYDPGYEEAGLDYPIGYVRWTEGRNLQAFVDLLGRGALEVKSLTSHRYDIEEAVQAYDLIRSQEDFLGVLLNYSQAASKTRASKKLAVSSKPVAKHKIGLGVLGAGNFARHTLLPALKGVRTVELVGIASAGGRAAADLAQRYGFRYAASDPAELLADKQVDALAVLTRHHLHASQTLAGLKVGKHVFCEKPLALHEAELARIERALAQKNAPQLTVGFNRRFAPLAQELAGFLAGRSQPLAAHFRVNAGPLPGGHWLQDPAQGGGRLLGEGCHFIDFLIFLAGQAPLAVSAAALGELGGQPQDNLQVTLRFADGSLGTLSYLSNGDRAVSKERLEVFCGGDVAVLDDFRRLELTRGGNTRRLRSGGDKGHAAIWAAFAASLQAGGPPPIPYEHIFSGARAGFAALRALETGGEVAL